MMRRPPPRDIDQRPPPDEDQWLTGSPQFGGYGVAPAPNGQSWAIWKDDLVIREGFVSSSTAYRVLKNMFHTSRQQPFRDIAAVSPQRVELVLFPEYVDVVQRVSGAAAAWEFAAMIFTRIAEIHAAEHPLVIVWRAGGTSEAFLDLRDSCRPLTTTARRVCMQGPRSAGPTLQVLRKLRALHVGVTAHPDDVEARGIRTELEKNYLLD